jgi:putative methionine-R-sulfoxide reductase with GAF domain
LISKQYQKNCWKQAQQIGTQLKEQSRNLKNTSKNIYHLKKNLQWTLIYVQEEKTMAQYR